MKFDSLEVIGIQGSMGSGKSSVAAYLVEHHGFTRLTMAGPLKDALMAMGATSEEIYGAGKMDPSDRWGGKTNRFAQQTLGTEWGRKIIHKDIWVNCMCRRITSRYEEAVSVAVPRKQRRLRVVIDDIRFPNEAAMVQDFGGEVWTIRRPQVEFSEWKQWALRTFGWWVGRFIGVHTSEAHWATAPADQVFHNTDTVGDLMVQADHAVTTFGDRV